MRCLLLHTIHDIALMLDREWTRRFRHTGMLAQGHLVMTSCPVHASFYMKPASTPIVFPGTGCGSPQQPASNRKDCTVSRQSSHVLAAALILAGAVPVLAATAPAPETTAQKTADKDFGKVSKDGRSALLDIRAVRLDIFNGRIDQAKTDIAKAVASLDKARTDETVFTKAEADLKAPAAARGGQAAGGAGTTAAGAVKEGTATAQAGRTPIEWLPVDGAMTIGEDYVATPEKNAGVKSANEKLAKGDQKGALDALKLADVDVDFLVEVAPLKATLAGVTKANGQLDAGQYYEANQSLKSVEDGLRLDDEMLIETPQKANAAKAG